MRKTHRWSLTMVVLGLAVAGCGYHLAGHGDALPRTIHVIAVPTMENRTTTFRIEQKLTAATIHEFLAKTRYKIVSDPNGGDAVLTGKVLSLEVVPLLFQSQTSAPTTGTTPTTIAQATAMMVTMKCELTLKERVTDKVLFHTDNFTLRNEYQLATSGTGSGTKSQVEAFFQEGDPALDRMAQEFAQRLVAAVTESF
ncbi:MAG TPA: LPS assembly lipoprotein LptE [Candidatus Limnocylindrales bacterium]|nr:LPS assembly lipoprotein LptE [Candidatus Limnocylindrales bacterium]